MTCPRRTPTCIVAVILLSAVGYPVQARAQQESHSLPAAEPEVQKEPKHRSSQKSVDPPKSDKPENDRIFFALPNYLTVEEGSSPPPLTIKQKFQMQTLGTFDPIGTAYIGLLAGIGQAQNTHPSFGQGLTGYAKRFGLAFGDGAVQNYMAGAVFPSLLRQDPRYYRKGDGPVLARAAHAAGRIFITHSDWGRQEVNFSEIAGTAVAAAISNTYHPGPQTLGSGAKIMRSQIISDVIASELKEFWPDIHRALRRKKQ